MTSRRESWIILIYKGFCSSEKQILGVLLCELYKSAIKVEFCHCCWTFYELSCVRIVPFMKERGEANSDVNRSEEVHIPFSVARGKLPPAAFLLSGYPMSRNACKPGTHTHTNRNVHIHGSLIVVALLLSCSVNVHNELAMHFSSHLVLSIPPPPPIFLFSLILSAFVSGWLFLLPSSFYSHFLTPAPIPSSLPPVFYLTSPLPVVLVCALVCHEEGGG